MKNILYLLMLITASGFTWHKYYVSVSEINIKPEKLEIIIRTFPDDIQNVLEDNYSQKIDLEHMDKRTEKYLKLYIQEHFVLSIDKQEILYTFSGFTFQDGFFIILLEAKIPNNIFSIQLKNTLLFDMFDEQKNIVHFLEKSTKESYILTKENQIAEYFLSK